MSVPKTSVPDSGALFQIEEPIKSTTRKRSPGRGIGIDLGTTHSLVALAPRGAAARALADGDGEALLPSVVSYVGDIVEVGQSARAQRLDAPGRVLSSVKRFMGRGTSDIDFPHPYAIADVQGSIRINVGGRVVSPVEVSAEILKALKHRAEAELGGPVDGAVITVPAYFDDAQRQATRDAGRIAGLEVYRLLAEPTAAALAYGLDRGGEGLFAVYDLGGGTFDISILRLRKGVFHVLATGGDSALGGDDLDREVARHLLEVAGVEQPDARQREEAVVVARRAKEALTESEHVDLTLTYSPLRGHVLTRQVLDELIEPIVRRTLAPCRRVLKDAGVSAKEIDGVVLVGGSTRVPLVRSLAEQTFRQPPLADIDPDRVVAYGAAIQADILSGSEREGVTLLDVVPLSLGLETMGGIVEKVIPRNATIPLAARQVFTNYSEQQTAMVIHVVQGERELVDDCRSLAKFDLRGIPRLPPSMARVEVTFELDADALLTVTARELMTGIKQSVEVKPTYGLEDAEVDRLVMESLDHAREDFTARDRAESRVELGRVVLAVRRTLEEVGRIEGMVAQEERKQIESLLATGDEIMAHSSASAESIREAREQLERASEPLARRRMERALRSGMQGQTLDEIEAALADGQALDEQRGGHESEIVRSR